MKDNYFKELSRVLKTHGIQSQTKGDERLEILANNQILCLVGKDGNICFNAQQHTTNETASIKEKLHPICYEVCEYTSLMKTASLVKSDSGNADFRLLADFGGAILAGKELENGYQFATWEKDGSGTGYTYGHYFGESYAAAKEDFAIRSGLVHRDKLFNESEMTVMHKSMKAVIAEGTFLAFDEEALAEELCETLEHFHPALKVESQSMNYGNNIEQTWNRRLIR